LEVFLFTWGENTKISIFRMNNKDFSTIYILRERAPFINLRHIDGRSFIRWIDGRGILLVDVHIVVKGDTLWKIARQYGIPFEELKRVNAHLANPDYIVPGMKIFLPKKKTAPLPSEKGKEKMPEKVKPSTSPAMEKPSKPKEPVPLPKEKPKFEMPKPPSVPKQPTPSAPVQKPPAMTPPPEPMPSIPPAVPTPPMSMPQFFQPIMPVPCGWMPIYDADCVPMPFPSFTQQMPVPAPTPVMPTQVMPSKEMPTTPAKLGVKPPSIEITEDLDEFEESPIYPGRGPGVSPPYPVRGWELMESPMMPLESPEHMVHCPPEQAYVPQMVSPQFQNPSEMMQPQQPFVFGYPCPPMPIHHCGCPHHGFYGFGPNEMQPNTMMPMQVSPMQMYPAQMYPMQMNPMHMHPFYPMDNHGCGC
jgi:morphogenetic protein associated with SpoVID